MEKIIKELYNYIDNFSSSRIYTHAEKSMVTNAVIYETKRPMLCEYDTIKQWIDQYNIWYNNLPKLKGRARTYYQSKKISMRSIIDKVRNENISIKEFRKKFENYIAEKIQ